MALHDLFAYGDLDQIVEALDRSGAWRAEPTRSAFVAAMIANRRQPQLRDLLHAEALDAAPPIQTRAARQLAEIGFPQAASAVLASAAAREGPNSAAMRDLVYIWRTHNLAPDLDWLTQRAAAANAELAPHWVERISEAVSPAAALEALARLEASARPEAKINLAMIRARYLGWGGDSPALRAALASVSQLELSRDQAVEIFHLACAVRDRPSVRRVSQALARPPADAHHCLSQIALDAAREAQSRGDGAAALTYYSDAAALHGLSAQDNFDYGFALENSGNSVAARRRYEMALQTLPPAPHDTPRGLALRGAIFARLGRAAEARELIETVYAADPSDRSVRLMLADLYVNQGAYRQALALTSDSQTQVAPN